MHHHLAYNKENKTETDPRPRFKPTVKKPEQRHPADNFTTKITLLISSLRSDIRSQKNEMSFIEPRLQLRLAVVKKEFP